MNPYVMGAMVLMSLLQMNKQNKAAQQSVQREEAKARYSPWTGIGPAEPMPAPDVMGGLMQAGVQGMAMSQNMDAADKLDAYQQAEAGRQDRMLNIMEKKYGIESTPAGAPNLPEGGFKLNQSEFMQGRPDPSLSYNRGPWSRMGYYA